MIIWPSSIPNNQSERISSTVETQGRLTFPDDRVLRRQEELVSPEPFDGFPDQLLVVTLTIDVRRVDEVYSALQCGLKNIGLRIRFLFQAENPFPSPSRQSCRTSMVWNDSSRSAGPYDCENPMAPSPMTETSTPVFPNGFLGHWNPDIVKRRVWEAKFRARDQFRRRTVNNS